MKKTFLTTTAIIAAFAATDAQAGDLQVNIGGYADFQAGYADDDVVASENDTNFNTDAEIHVSVEGSSDNGLEYGAVLELEANVGPTTDQFDNGTNADKAYLFVQGGWGRVELGENTGAEEALAVNTANFASATGGVEGDFFRYTGSDITANAITRPQLALAAGGFTTGGESATDEDATKITYYSPRFAGFQLGASYIPNSGDTSRTNVALATAPGDLDNEDVFTGGVNYANQFDEIGLTASLTGITGTAKLATANDIEGYAVGANLTFAGFTLGGSYGDYLDTFGDNVDADYYDLGLGYSVGAFSASVSYLDSEIDGVSEFDNLVIGADYQLAPGLVPYAEVSFFDVSETATPANDNDGTVIILGTQLSF